MKILLGSSLLVSTICATTAFAQSSDIPLKTVIDLQKTCQISVPNDWKSDEIMHSDLTSADKKLNLIVGSLAPGLSFDEAKSTSKEYVPVEKIIEDSADRLTYVTPSTSGKSSHKVTWYSVIKTQGEAHCNVQITFDPSQEAEAKKVIATVSAASKAS